MISVRVISLFNIYLCILDTKGEGPKEIEGDKDRERRENRETERDFYLLIHSLNASGANSVPAKVRSQAICPGLQSEWQGPSYLVSLPLFSQAH